ncbi:uncharacterized protein LOC143545702 [Bidens hawaiensis]|uniref:uncharacterized protein LOC143545702 n=1 Tax=Bidens hawaiensis TaxID=980011 RepID=UPI00404949CE
MSYQSIDVIGRNLSDEIREAELKIVTLESVLEESISIVDSKNMYIKETENLVKKLTNESDHLQSVLLTMKNDSNERLNGLEEEVRILWGTARRNNFELHSLESKAQDVEKRLEVIKSRVEMMSEIVNQQWIQIQHLEQALLIAQKGSEEIVSRCSFLKFLKRAFVNKCPEILEATWSKIKQNHHQLQGFVKKEMQKGKYTAALANKEVVFFLASALITFPALSLGVFLLNNFC